jgi:glycine/D-amino acid oxidase-like deaminating enzyme
LKNRILIVGHGLSGAILAHTFLQKKQSVDVCEANFPYHASKIAAGLVNPFIGPKLNTPVDIEECFTEIKKFGDYFEKLGGERFYYSLPMYRVFKTSRQADFWADRSQKTPHFCERPGIINNNEASSLGIRAPYGMGLTKCLRLHIQSFIEYSKHRLMESEQWIEGPVDYDRCSYQKIIFCEGFRVMDNPWFSFIPAAPVRGEIIGVDSYLETSVSNGTWAIPISREHFMAGSTWDHEVLETGPSQKAKEQILRSLNFIKIDPGKISKQLSGVRTGTVDRNPILGSHPQNKKLFIFNGFGSRGATTIPLHAKQMVEYILNSTPLPPLVDVARFKEFRAYKK